MGFLRRFLGAGRESERRGGADADADRPDGRTDVDEPVDPDEAERAHELELARFEQERTDDLVRRQQLYADRSWTPPAQGGERRADDAAKG
jgi:hypothetical protein